MALEHDGVSVRYACKCGQLSPVRAMFFSDLCQKPVCRRPSCALEEFESFYCGHLLVNLPSKEASMYQNRSSRCFACPTCATVLSTAFHEAQQRYFFLCAHCRWDSLEVGLAEEDPDMLVMSAIARERESTQEDVFHTLLSHYSSVASSAASSLGKTRGVGQGISLLSLADSMKELQREQQMKKFRLNRMAEMGGWRYEQVQEKMDERAQWLLDQRKETEWPQLAAQLAALPSQAASASNWDTSELLTGLAKQSDMGEVSTLSRRLLHPLEQPRESSKVYLSRPPLRAKRTWRCVESIEKGSAGILVKPQISPMSGDSSLPVATSWFKKANLAVHYLPIVTFQRLPWRSQDSDAIESILLVENPLDDPVRLVLRESNGSSELGDGFLENAKAVIEDFSPITIGAYEDPNLAEAPTSHETQGGNGGSPVNPMLIQASRNTVKLRVLIRPNSSDQHVVSFRITVETEKLDEEGNEVIENSFIRIPIAITAPIQT